MYKVIFYVLGSFARFSILLSLYDKIIQDQLYVFTGPSEK
jgi:hypothetical protein